MDRRTFVGAFAGGLVIAPAAVKGQSAAKLHRIGYLAYATAEQAAPLVRTFTTGMRDLGYVEDRDFVFEQRYGDGTLDRLPDLAADLARSRVDVIVTGSYPMAAAAKRATTSIPIVMIGVVDPVGLGLIANLARPGGNITGLAIDAGPEMTAKGLGLLKEIIPGLARVGVLRQVQFETGMAKQLEVPARKLNVTLDVVDVRTIGEIESAFATLGAKRVGAVIISGSMFWVRRRQIAELALQHRLPAFHALKDYAQAGLLVTYGANLDDLYRRAAAYVDRILKGARPGDLPVEQPAKFELVINLKTARALGLTIAQAVLLRADEVIR